MISVTIYVRQDDERCQQALADLSELQAIVPHELKKIEIDSDPELVKQWGESVPVVEAGPYRLKTSFTRQDLQITLQAAAHGIKQEQEIDAAIAQGKIKLDIKWTGADRFSHWWSRHYLAVCNIFVLLYVGLPFLAPTLAHSGQSWLADRIYDGYSFVCHQYAFRSWFLFGEQAVYPREAAHVPGLITYEQATGLGPFDDLAARAFRGNPVVGYKVALCERDVAIYFGIFFFGVFFSVTGRKIKGLKWYWWVLIGVIPMGLDGGSQLVLQVLQRLNMIDFARESTPFLRTLTGALFGVTTAWFGYPLVEETMRETLEYFDGKLARIRNLRSQGAVE